MHSLKINSIHSIGMAVTNTIRDEVVFENNEWRENKLKNTEILLKLLEEKNKGFLNFAWGIYVTRICKKKFIKYSKRVR